MSRAPISKSSALILFQLDSFVCIWKEVYCSFIVHTLPASCNSGLEPRLHDNVLLSAILQSYTMIF